MLVFGSGHRQLVNNPPALWPCLVVWRKAFWHHLVPVGAAALAADGGPAAGAADCISGVRW